MKKITIASDIDHTMLPPGLDPDGIPEAVEALLSNGVDLVLVTAKTVEETILVMETIGLTPEKTLAAVENAAIIIAGPGLLPEPHETENVLGYSVELHYIAKQDARERLLAIARKACPGILSINEMSPSEIMKLTRLPLEHAQAATKRRVTLSLYHPSRRCLQEAQEALERAGANTALGASFLHAYTHIGKAEAIRYLRRHPHYYSSLIVALGDSPVDKGMLEEADIAIVVPRNEGLHVKPARDYMIAPQPAPHGWIHAVQHLLLSL